MFSELVDEVVIQTGRRDRMNDIADFARLTMRECQGIHYFSRDLVEDQITATQTPQIWDRPVGFRQMWTVRYGADRYPKFARPGRLQSEYTDYYYSAGNYFAFIGVFPGEEVKMAYFMYAPDFVYLPVGFRPAVYNRVTQTWQYRQPDGTYADHIPAATPEEQEILEEAARNFVAHWLLLDWWQLIKTGTMTKLYAMIDDPRGPKLFSMYKEQQTALDVGERYETLGA